MNDNFQILEPIGTLNAAKGNEIRREIEYVMTSGIDIVLIDLKNVQLIDSSGLGALVSTMQFVRKSNKKLYICSVNNQVQMLFELTKMDRIMQILKDREEFEKLEQVVKNREELNSHVLIS
ncbi:MAG: STAS domain-containing protein [Gloeotrichia echinulata DVL01]|jgi:anti-sigma B factor antagonist|nr:STAS domain-containing protein [Gloeotrichia echinulata DEX184]